MSQAPAREPHLASAALKAQAQRRQAEVVARWRAVNKDATCSDRVAICLAELAMLVGRLPEAK